MKENSWKSISDINLNLLEEKKYKSKKKDAEYQFESDIIITFDIETTSAWINENGEVIPYIPRKPDEYWSELTPIALPYKWQLSIEDEVYHGRLLSDIPSILRKFPKDTHLIIWVHNLGFEFSFLQNYFENWKIFARNMHKPIYAIPEEFPNIEFRCSMSLTHFSLETWGDILGFPKLHSLDYNILRTPLTNLSDEEMEYCERDCLVVYKGIQKFLEKYNHIRSIPLTQTGQVRREVKKRVRKDKQAYRLAIKMIPESVEMYRIYHKIFSGGYTHANYTLSGWTIEPIESFDTYAGGQFDFASSYPYHMIAFKYPVSNFTRDIWEPEKRYKFAYILHLRLTNVKAKTSNHYLSSSKCERCINGTFDNGRIIDCDELELWTTDADWDIFSETYSFDMEVLDCYRARKGYLPKIFIEYILELYCQKTTLKGVKDEELPGAEALYAESKQYINSLFGMAVTDLIQDSIIYNKGDWSVEYKSEKEVNDFLDDLKCNNKGRSFMAYQWGPWITAYSRRSLWSCILGKDLASIEHTEYASSNDEDVIYCDTDSIKMRGFADFSWYNKLVDERVKTVCQWYDIDFERTRPVDPKGKKHPIGHFEAEEPFIEFKTLGAKRYIYRTEDKKLHMTVSGINKDAVKDLNDDIKNFTDGTIFDKDSPNVRKKLHTYLSEMPDVIWNKGQYDEFHSFIKYGINLRPTGYHLKISSDYLDLIDLEEVFDNFGNDQHSRLAIFG